MPSMDPKPHEQDGSGRSSRAIQEATYALPGNGSVRVQMPFGKSVYSAIVTMTGGEYPGEGRVARDRGREEFLSVLDGSFCVTINGATHELAAGANLMIRDGDSYTISGQGRCLVLVRDSEGGTTEILPAAQGNA